MKRFIESLVCAIVLLCMAVPAWAQSTQGKEFWVSSSIVCSPANGKGISPYIAVSAEKACTVTITDYQGNSVIKTGASGQVLQNIAVAAGSWTEFGEKVNTDTTKGPIQVYLDPAKWYPINTKEPATVYKLAGKQFMYGLHITATENISVYVILGGESSMDASNILPLTALGSEYYTQDYKPEAHNDKSWSTNAGNMVTVTTILGTENETTVDIVPNGNTNGGENNTDSHASGVSYPITLNQGEVYYLISEKEKQLSGTHITARDNKKIAIFTGSPLTRLPNGVSARDALFEQPLPVDYWGTQFIVARSLGKNANIIGITAMNDLTEVKLNGRSQNPKIILSEGQTYYIVLQNDGDPQGKEGDTNVQKTINGDVLYIETSCPCAVYNYDTGSGFAGNGKDASGAKIDETVSGKAGDPSSVWVSPIQQKIGKITFGTCYTDKTKDHFLNIVAETATCQNTKLTALSGGSQIDKSNLLVWTPVPGNTAYSYARAQIGTASTSQYSVFRLENPKGFIATIYGNGDNESYAYSAGSSAVELGVDINGETFTDNYISDTRFCMGTTMNFDANLGGKYSVTRVDWDFGDGISEYNSTVQISHDYTVPGWYDVEAELYGQQVCTDDANQWLGKLKFSFRIVRPDTVHVDSLFCIPEDKSLPADEIETKDDGKCDTVYIIHKHYAKKSTRPYSMTVKVTDGYEMHGHWYTDPYQEDTFYVGQNAAGCDSFEICQLTLKMCLVIDIPERNLHICPDDPFNLAYTLSKGEMGEMRFISGSTNVVLNPSNGYVGLPTQNMKPGMYQAKITVQDLVCDTTLEFPLNMTVNYSREIFKFKFNNVLAVYNKDYNGGYVFTEYQWYYNDEKIEGANTSVYHSETPLEPGEYFVMLTDANGLTMPTCVKKIRPEDIPDYSELLKAPATKHLINRQIVIRKGEQSYNIYGQRVE